MMTSKLTLLLLSLLPLLTSASHWWKNETTANFVPFPPEVSTRLTQEAELYKKESFDLPVLRVFQKYPEDPKQRLWPELKGMNQRLHPTLWPRVHYYVEEGLQFGCRKPDPDSQTGETLPITTGHCHRHCLHQGRYCLREPDLHSDHRRAALKEIMRRLCMDTIYHAKDPRFVAYLEHYDYLQCFGNASNDTAPQNGFRNCSLTAMNLAGMKYPDIASCVQEDKYDQDIPHETMNRNLRHWNKMKDFNYSIPYMTLADAKLQGNPLTADAIFPQYCDTFPTRQQQPLACHACKNCDNVRDCLWTLQCNGQPFDFKKLPTTILDLTAAEEAVEKEPEYTEAPTEAYQDNDTDNTLPDTLADMVEEEEELANEDDKFESDLEPEGRGGLLFWAIFMILLPLVCITIFVYYMYRFRQERAKKLLADLANGGTLGLYKTKYRDNPDVDEDYNLGGRVADDDSERKTRSRAMELLSIVDNGISVRNLHTNTNAKNKKHRQHQRDEVEQLSFDSEGSNRKPFSDDFDHLEKFGAYSDHPENHSTATGTTDEESNTTPSYSSSSASHQDDLVVEDMLEEESEWVESKRGNKRAMAANSTLC